jgi:hypothetical protein
MGVKRLGLLGVAAFALAFGASTAIAGSPTLVDQAAHSLLARQQQVTWIDGHHTGSAWKSVIASPNFGTGRGSGAAGVGMGLLAAYDSTGNAAYLNAASEAGDFLLAAQTPGDSGRWPDYFNPSGPAEDGFTSFDNGAPGIADFLWRLYEHTGKATYATTSLSAMDWEISKAQSPLGQSCPSVCLWHWRAPATARIYTGMGDGVAGIAWAFNAFATRRAAMEPARAAGYAKYAQAGAAWLESEMTHPKLAHGEEAASIPERPGSKLFATGYNAGAAGDAFLFYQLYLTTGRNQYRHDGDLLLNWVRAQGVKDGSCAGLRWPVESTGHGSKVFATGFDDGAAGVGWVALQAYKLLINRSPAEAIKDLEMARAAGDWLLSPCAAHDKSEKAYWPDNEGRKLVHTNLDSGASGVAVFLYDLYVATGSPSYRNGASDAERWVASVAFDDHGASYWCGHVESGSWGLCREPSWRWGEAGIVDMAARLQGWPLDIPGEQPGLARRN